MKTLPLLGQHVNRDSSGMSCVQNITGWTALHEAATTDQETVVRHLLMLGASVHTKTREGDTALHKAARWNRLDTVRTLLTAGSDADAVDNVSSPQRIGICLRGMQEAAEAEWAVANYLAGVCSSARICMMCPAFMSPLDFRCLSRITFLLEVSALT